jgi:hypothetical protein
MDAPADHHHRRLVLPPCGAAPLLATPAWTRTTLCDCTHARACFGPRKRHHDSGPTPTATCASHGGSQIKGARIELINWLLKTQGPAFAKQNRAGEVRTYVLNVPSITAAVLHGAHGRAFPRE